MGSGTNTHLEIVLHEWSAASLFSGGIFYGLLFCFLQIGAKWKHQLIKKSFIINRKIMFKKEDSFIQLAIQAAMALVPSFQVYFCSEVNSLFHN